MLPTAGYFRGIACPHHEKSYCHRPYCHFRHNPKKDTTSYSPQRPTSKTDVEGDETDSTNEASMDSAACSTTTMITEHESSEKPPLEEGQEGPSVTHEEEDQSDLLQQLVSEAVKKVLAENPVLASSGVDPSTIMKSIDTSALIAQAAQVNAKAKKKFYFRPPDTPKYNPTPIEELNKRKRSADYSEDSFAPKAKIGKYTPTPISAENTVIDSAEVGPGSKEEADGEITDFSSDEDEDEVDKRRCDFDILEEVLAEHSQNNKIKVKKKKGKALGKLQYSLSIPEKNVDESAMISDARNMSDQDSNTCDTLRISSEAKVPTEESYFLPPSPIFTSSSDGFGAFSSIVYAKSCTSPEECESSSNIILSDKNITTSPGATSNAEESNTVKQLEPYVKVDKKMVGKDDTKKKVKGHIHLPQVVHTLGAPKLIRPNIRNWTPHVRSNTSDSRKDGDPLEEMLELMDGNDAAAQEESKGNSKQSPASGGQEVASTKKTHKYKVDLDKEIESLTNSPSKRDESTSHDRLDSAKKDLDKQVEGSEINDNAQEAREATQVNIEKTKPNQNKEIKTNACETNKKKHMKEKETNSKNDPLDSQSDKSSNSDSVDKCKQSEERIESQDKRCPVNKGRSTENKTKAVEKNMNKKHTKEKKKNSKSDPLDRESEEEFNNDDAVDKGVPTEDTSDSEKEQTKRKRKRKHSYTSSSDSDHFHHRKKRKKSHKRNRKHNRTKKRRKRKNSRSDSSDSDEESEKDGKDAQDSKDTKDKDSKDAADSKPNDKCEASGEGHKEEVEEEDIVKPKKHKKHRKKSKHRRKLKHKRKKKKLKSKKKGSKNSSSSSRSRSSSRDRSRSSSRSRSRSSSVHKSRSLSREGRRSSRKNKRRSSNQHRSRSASQNRSRSSSQNRSRSSSKDISRSSSKLRSKSSSIHRSRSSSIHRSRRSNDHRSRSSSTQRSSSSDHRSSSSTHRSPSKHRSRTTSKSRNKGSSKHSSSNKHRSRSTSKQRSRSLSKNRSHSSSKSSVNKSQSISRSGKPETRKNSNANTKNKSNKSSKESAYMENSQPLSTPMPIDPSKIKTEIEELVPDLSIVKTEKVDEESVDTHSKKKDSNSIEDANQRQNYVNDKNVYSSNHRSSSRLRKESESYRKKDKEQMKLSSNADSKRRNSHERKNSTESISEKTPTSIRRSSSDSKKSETDISSDKKKADRRPSTDKMKKDKVSNSSADSQPKVMSMFDMVLANTQTPKPKAFTEISIFDSVCDNYDTNTDSSAMHSEDEVSPGDSHSNVMQEPSPHKKSSQSHSNSKSKAESASTTEKITDRQRPEVNNPPRRKSRSYSNSSSKDGKDDFKRSHSSSTKHKSNSFNHDVNTDSSLSSSEDETNQKGPHSSKTQEPSTNKKSSQSQSNGKSKAESGSKTENTSGHQRPEGISHLRSSRSHSNSSSKDGKDEAMHPHSSSTKHKSSSYNYDGNTDSSVSPFEDEMNHRGSRNTSRTRESSTNKKSQSQFDAKSKTESGPRTDNTSDHQRPEGKTHSRLSRTHSNSSSKDESKHSHSSASKHNSSGHHRSSNHHSSSGIHIRGSGSTSSKAHQSSNITSSSSSSKSKRKESRSESSSSQSSKSSKHHQSSKKSSSNKNNSSSSINKHESIIGNKEKGCTNSDAKKSGTDSKVDDATTSKHPQGQEESSSGISDRESFFYNDTGNESPLPYLSELDEITLDDLEEMMSSSEKVDMKHLENLEDSDDNDRYELDKDDPEVMEECLKMYNEYQPTQEDLKDQASSKKGRLQSVNEEPDHQGKQRIARTDSCGNLIAKKPLQRKKTPTQMMMERYQKLKEQKAKYAELSKNQKQQLRVGESSATTLKSHASSSTLLMSPPNSSSGGSKRRISHVPNVSSLLHARDRIKNLPPPSSRTLLSPSVAKASGAIPQTTVQTAKGGKRIAHVPRTETLARPIIPAEFGSKVPQNIRQRYLNSLIDECLKFTGEKDAFNIAAAEEHTCFKRASSRMVYLNLTVNAIKRLRTQQKAGEAAQELLDKDPQFAEHLFVEETSSAVQPSTSSAASSQGIGAKSNPTNLNQVKLSHFTVLAGGGQRGSWSIEKPKKSTNDFQEYLKGEAFYKLMMKYVLSSEHLEQNGYPLPDPDVKGKAITKAIDTRKKISPSSVERYCARCSTLYMIDKWGFPTSVGPCVHHWGRAYKRRTYSGFEARYSCCSGDLESEGCCQATTHVSDNYNPNELHGYVRTLPKEIKGNDPGVYALDCEMCYTTGGNELTRVTVINVEGNTVYEHLVKPENPIIDYNTRFSGITESDMVDVKTTILDVQAALLTLFSDKTILIGHSLESDFHALKLIHDTVVDTSVVFPHKMGPPYKRALRNLASEYLKTIIQNDVSGHDSAEDALTCMQLMQWRIKEDLKGLK